MSGDASGEVSGERLRLFEVFSLNLLSGVRQVCGENCRQVKIRNELPIRFQPSILIKTYGYGAKRRYPPRSSLQLDSLQCFKVV